MICCWDVITIGNISRNRYWGEGDGRAMRDSYCTSTLIVTEGRALLVDPAFADQDRMAEELDRRTGLKLSDVDAVFVTHSHSDHHEGLANYPNARLLAAPAVAGKINASAAHPRPVEPAGERVLDDMLVIHTPGHTPDHHSLLLEWQGLNVVVAGDAVMRRDFWDNRQGYHNSWNFDIASRTIDELTQRADIIIPGHDNYFLTHRASTA